jgi:hypothetical protein
MRVEHVCDCVYVLVRFCVVIPGKMTGVACVRVSLRKHERVACEWVHGVFTS